MATRSFIGKVNSDNTITAIYCHWDGYPEHVGSILRYHYDSPEKIDELLENGDASSIDAELDKCEFYMDNGEIGHEAVTYQIFDDFFNDGRDVWAEFFYLFDNGNWVCYDSERTVVEIPGVVDGD